ncbi:MAG: hypothetical protein JWO68_2855, partial [Actinomycetia bacterium]|nr:hypothetical protein [Actinomycetes bacterium]
MDLGEGDMAGRLQDRVAIVTG